MTHVKGIFKLALLLALAIVVLFAVPALASAQTIPHEGQFCAEHDHGKTVGNLTCVKDDGDHYWHWKKTIYPSASPSTSLSTGPTATPSVSPTSTPPVVSASPTPAAALPVTGGQTDLMIGGGVALVGLGCGAVLWGRRRRTRFEA